MNPKKLRLVIAAVVGCLVVATAPIPASAHCDSLDGPVVTLARKALETGNVNFAFEHTVSVRQLGPQAKQLADTFFFETLVRVHRASEGAPYTGLKPAGVDLGPAIPAADRALQQGSTEAVEKLLIGEIHKGLQQHFRAAASRKRFAPDDVACLRTLHSLCGSALGNGDELCRRSLPGSRAQRAEVAECSELQPGALTLRARRASRSSSLPSTSTARADRLCGAVPAS
jgi:hypothetical protein